jgi:hypothetical protein
MTQKMKGRAPRKKGEWVSIAKGRSYARRELVTNPGANQRPRIGDVGSAAYRRLLASRKEYRK